VEWLKVKALSSSPSTARKKSKKGQTPVILAIWEAVLRFEASSGK
jgi:hypothetical protein